MAKLFEGVYDDWRKKRIEKIKKVLGPDCFRGKTVLELGCGHGHTGKILTDDFGAKVTFAEGRKEYEEQILLRNPGAEVIILDQDTKWDLNRKFDAIIHWGVLYHLDNWQQDLNCACNHTDLLFLESEVSPRSNDPDYEYKFTDLNNFDQALNRKATRPSAANIEKELLRNGFEFVCYDDDPDMNSSRHQYHWQYLEGKEKNNDYGYRKYWIAKRK